jgi:hypothetical protein
VPICTGLKILFAVFTLGLRKLVQIKTTLKNGQTLVSLTSGIFQNFTTNGRDEFNIMRSYVPKHALR